MFPSFPGGVSDNSERFLFRSTWKMFGLKTYGPIRITTVEPREHLKDPCKQKHHWNDKKESRVVGRPWYNHRPPYIAWTPRLGVRKFTAKQNIPPQLLQIHGAAWTPVKTDEWATASGWVWGLGFFGGFIDAPEIFYERPGVKSTWFARLVVFLVLKRFW